MQLVKSPEECTDDPFSEIKVGQRFYFNGNRLIRDAKAGRYGASTYLAEHSLPAGIANIGPSRAWFISRLRGLVPQTDEERSKRKIRVIDLYCGAGGFSQGVKMGAEAVGLNIEIAACADMDSSALNVFDKNLSVGTKINQNIDVLLDFAVRYVNGTARFAYPPEVLNPELAAEYGRVDMVIGGPPCQGHSNFNNHTRRSDPRNALYLTVPAFGVAVRAPVIIVENVPTVVADQGKVVEKARSILTESGYFVQDVILDADMFGVPQQRRRHFMLATTQPTVSVDKLSEFLPSPTLTVWDAIGDLADIEPSSVLDLPAELSEENRQRIDYLFDNDLYNLPNDVRPDCHKDGHSYPSVYGRIYPDKPAQTITGGFLSPGRGRFTHPTCRRSLTPHEAARLQGFPDDFVFQAADGNGLLKKDFAKLIGDAIPPPLAYAVAMVALATL